MASRFWVGGTGTWDGSDTTHWASTSGGAGGQTVPGAADVVTFNGSSGGGTVTVNTTVNITQFFTSGFAGTLDFATNNNNVTTTYLGFDGTATRTINMGSGTWTLTGTSGSLFDINTSGLTPSFASANLVANASAAGRTMGLSGQTFASLTISANSSHGYVALGSGAATFTTVTINSGNVLQVPQAGTLTVTGALTITGSSSALSGLASTTTATNATISVGSASTIDYGTIYRMTKAGAGAITITNSYDLGGNSGLTIGGPPAGSSVVGVIGG